MVHPELVTLFQKLQSLRLSSGYSPAQVEEKFVLGPGWVSRLENGEAEPSLGTLAAILSLYGQDLSSFFSGLDFGEDDMIIDRHLSGEDVNGDLVLHFPMGPHKASVVFPSATVAQLNEVLLVLRDELAKGKVADAIVATFLKAVAEWPHINPSDIWYFLISHAYQDDFNHPAVRAGTDWGQSWKRAGGWSLEAIYVNHYNPYFLDHGIELVMPEPKEKKRLLSIMGLTDKAAVEKSDVIAMGTDASGEKHPFGVVHVKASFAERRTDDAPLSAKLMASNYASPLLTMDCKASPSSRPENKGELGAVQGGTAAVSSKRLDIERDRIFDAAFSYNTNTVPTPLGASSAARIYRCDFSNRDDAFSKHMIRKWADRQGA